MTMKSDVLSQSLTLAAVAVVLTAAMPDLSWAQNLKGSVDSVEKGITRLPVVVSGLIYILSAVFIMTGALALKKHSENPGSTPLSSGLTKMGLGGTLAAVQPAIGWIQSSLSTSGTATGIGKILPPIGEGN